MSWLERWRAQPGWLETVALGGLLLVIAIAGVVALSINNQLGRTTEQALAFDMELENRSDDFRVAILDMSRFHRNISLVGPTRRGLEDYENAYLLLQRQIDRLEALGVTDPNVYSPAELRAIAQQYYDNFRPAIDLYDEERQAFDQASDAGLLQIAELQGAAIELDRLGEQRAAEALRRIDEAESRARAALLIILIGLVLTGVALSSIVVQNTREKQAVAVELARALDMKNAFIADASHELRTPLTVLRANAEVGLDLDRSCVHTELLEEIVQESVRMTRLVEDLLFLARSDADGVPLETEVVSVEPFLAELAERAGILAREHGAALQQELRAQGAISIDPARIEQVVLILVDNAAKYSPAGSQIMLRSATRGGELIVEVVDHGPGIPEADLALVFERFYRVNVARSRRRGGTGLGLPIARSIVEGHGGRIEAQSRLNEGTTMRFILPLEGR